MYSSNLQGEAGGNFFGDTANHVGNWLVLIAITDVEIESIEMPKFEGVPNLASISLTAGTYLVGNITQIKLTSGIAQLITATNPV